MHVSPSLPCRRPVGTRLPGAPHHLLRVPHIRTLLFCIGISIKLPVPICCRGTLSFRHGDQMLYIILHVSVFINCLNLAYVIRIMITFKMFKIVFAPCPREVFAHSSFAMPSTCGNPVVGSTPPSLACSTHPHTSRLHRYLNQVIEIDMLPWHHF